MGKDVTPRKQAEHALQASEERYRAFIEQTAEGVWRIEMKEPVADRPARGRAGGCTSTRTGTWPSATTRWPACTGSTHASELLGVALGDLVPRSDPHNIEYLREFVRQGYRLLEAESHERDVEGRDRYFLNNLIGIVEGGKLRRAWGSQRDITERRRAELQLRQVDRLEAVGQLAGGVAHEANNQMSVILGCAEFVLRRDDIDTEVRQDVEHIQRAAERTAGITQQLLAFSSRQLLHLQVLEVNAIVRQLEPILRRTLQPDQQLSVSLGAEPDLVWADSGQLDQVLLNLTLNARDAMQAGGMVAIETSTVQLTRVLRAGEGRHRDRARPLRDDRGERYRTRDGPADPRRASSSRSSPPRVSAAGPGSDCRRCTASSSSAAASSGPTASPDIGTTFKTYLPLAEAEAWRDDTPEAARSDPRPARPSCWSKTSPWCGAWWVECCASSATRSKRRRTAAKPSARLDGARPDLIITDLVMPEMGGRELAASLTERFPDLPVLFTSGYTDNEAVRRELVNEHRPFLQKPLGPDILLRTVRDLLDGV